MSTSDYDKKYGHLASLADIALDLGMNVHQLERWAEKGKKNDFPDPDVVLGRYKLYDKEKVAEWVHLWRKINKNLGSRSARNQ